MSGSRFCALNFNLFKLDSIVRENTRRRVHFFPDGPKEKNAQILILSEKLLYFSENRESPLVKQDRKS